MAQVDTLTRIEQLLDNDYAQEQLQDGLRNLRAAYQRASKRRVEATRDERLRRHVQAAAASFTEAASAVRSGRKKPETHWGRRLLGLAAVGGVGLGVALAASNKGG
jgi:hypothetical protein